MADMSFETDAGFISKLSVIMNVVGPLTKFPPFSVVEEALFRLMASRVTLAGQGENQIIRYTYKQHLTCTKKSKKGRAENNR